MSKAIEQAINNNNLDQFTSLVSQQPHACSKEHVCWIQEFLVDAYSRKNKREISYTYKWLDVLCKYAPSFLKESLTRWIQPDLCTKEFFQYLDKQAIYFPITGNSLSTVMIDSDYTVFDLCIKKFGIDPHAEDFKDTYHDMVMRDLHGKRTTANKFQKVVRIIDKKWVPSFMAESSLTYINMFGSRYLHHIKFDTSSQRSFWSLLMVRDDCDAKLKEYIKEEFARIETQKMFARKECEDVLGLDVVKHIIYPYF